MVGGDRARAEPARREPLVGNWTEPAADLEWLRWGTGSNLWLGFRGSAYRWLREPGVHAPAHLALEEDLVLKIGEIMWEYAALPNKK